jgi:hypothetical protein
MVTARPRRMLGLLLMLGTVAACSGSRASTTPAASSARTPSAAATPQKLTAVPASLPFGEQPTKHFKNTTVTFDYPADWQVAGFPLVTSFSNDYVGLSTSPLFDPCASPAGCEGPPVASLASGGLYVIWSARSWAPWTFDPSVGKLFSVGPRRATLEEKAPTDACRSVGGVRSLVAIIESSAPRNWVQMDACLAGPDPAPAQAQIEAMLATAWVGQ